MRTLSFLLLGGGLGAAFATGSAIALLPLLLIAPFVIGRE